MLKFMHPNFMERPGVGKIHNKKTWKKNNMKNNEYIQNCLKTESRDWEPVKERLQETKTVRLLHGSMGAATESSEMLDAIKKHVFYGKPLDLVNMREEIGDLLWYVSVMLDALDTTYENVMKTNIDKLKARYGDKFSENSAINRDLEKEREILEK